MPKSGKIITSVTGEIGAGKTTYTKEFEKQGAYPVYADVIAHEILKLDEVKSLIEKSFGKSLFKDNSIDSKKLAEKTFENKISWQTLIDITHPYILEKIDKIITESDYSYYAIDAPLLFESRLNKDSDFIVLIKADPELREKRIKNRMSWEEAEKRTSYLIPIEEKEKMADIVIFNNSKEKRKVEENVEKILRRIKSKRG